MLYTADDSPETRLAWYEAQVARVLSPTTLEVVGGSQVCLAGLTEIDHASHDRLREEAERQLAAGTRLSLAVDPRDETAIQELAGQVQIRAWAVPQRSPERGGWKTVNAALAAAGVALPHQPPHASPETYPWISELLLAHQQAVLTSRGVWQAGQDGASALLRQIFPGDLGEGRGGDPANCDWYRAAVERIVDADTLVLTGGRRVRLLGVDGFESDTQEGRLASQRLRQLLPVGESIDVGVEHKGDSLDPYGRILAWVNDAVVRGDEHVALVQEKLAREGLVIPYRPAGGAAHTYLPQVLRATSDAIDAGRGIWAPGGVGPSLLAKRHYGPPLERSAHNIKVGTRLRTGGIRR